MNQHESGAGPAQWLAGLWEYYRGYTQTAVHAAATAALTAFGLLIFIDPLFAILAILSYLTPPIALYSLGTEAVPSESDHDPATPMTNVNGDAKTTRVDGDSDSDGNDTDSDGDDGDSDSDGDDRDTDSDGADADTDG